MDPNRQQLAQLDFYLPWLVVRVVNVTSVRHHHIETGMDPKMKSSPTLLPLSSAPLQDCVCMNQIHFQFWDNSIASV